MREDRTLELLADLQACVQFKRAIGNTCGGARNVYETDEKTVTRLVVEQRDLELYLHDDCNLPFSMRDDLYGRRQGHLLTALTHVNEERKKLKAENALLHAQLISLGIDAKTEAK